MYKPFECEVCNEPLILMAIHKQRYDRDTFWFQCPICGRLLARTKDSFEYDSTDFANISKTEEVKK